MSQSKWQLTGVSRTMILTTRARADEDSRPDGLFHNPQAREWSDRLPWDADLDSFYNFQTHTIIS